MLISPAEAGKTVLETVPLLPAEDCPLAQAHERVLRAPVDADRDLPPFDRVTMDGYALRHAEWAAGRREFRVIGLQAAGMIPLKLDAPGDCVEIATGAVLPGDADCVVPYEDVQRDGATIVISTDATLAAGHCVHRRGSDRRAGDAIVVAGTRLDSRAIAVAAACGRATLRVSALPHVAVVVTGDELIDVESPSPAPHQIRRSNDYALRAALIGAGYPRVERFHLRDLKYELETQLKRLIAEFDVILLSGGVSKGKFDFLPIVLSELGVVKKFQGVAQRPGKPFWFGLTSRRTPVFALPGNPVSAYTCFHRYVLPALGQMSGATPPAPEYVALANDVAPSPELTLYVPVRIEHAPDGRRLAHAQPANTSGDFSALVATDGFIEVAPGTEIFSASSVARYWPWI
jgi:molybdopterin molybdotransferase